MSKGKQSKSKDSQEIEALKNQLARALADYDNLRKRVEAEKEAFVNFANLKLITRLLPVYDLLMRVQRHLKDQGLASAISELEGVFRQEGVEKIKVRVDDKFNPEEHEAVEVVDNGKKKGKIAEVLIEGWRSIKGPVIRHAKVKVYSDKVEKKEG